MAQVKAGPGGRLSCVVGVEWYRGWNADGMVIAVRGSGAVSANRKRSTP
jgi:hypothetical protein